MSITPLGFVPETSAEPSTTGKLKLPFTSLNTALNVLLANVPFAEYKRFPALLLRHLCKWIWRYGGDGDAGAIASVACQAAVARTGRCYGKIRAVIIVIRAAIVDAADAVDKLVGVAIAAVSKQAALP
jgi:hypothetical protein